MFRRPDFSFADDQTGWCLTIKRSRWAGGSVPAELGDSGAAAAEDTVGGAVAVAEQAPAELAGPLLTEAEH